MVQITIEHDQFTAASATGKRSALGKRFDGMAPGLLVDLNEIPAKVLEALLFKAIEDHLQVGLKTLDKEKCTKEEVQAAMQARLDILLSGAISTAASPRKAPTQDPVKKEARAILKKAIQARSEEKLNGTVLTKAVSGLFKLHAEHAKAVKAEDQETIDKTASSAKLVEDAIAEARVNIKKANDMAKTLAPLVDAVKKASKAADAAKEAKPKPATRTAPKKAKPASKPAAR